MRSRSIQAFVAVLLTGGLLSFVVPFSRIPRGFFWLGVLALAAVAAFALRGRRAGGPAPSLPRGEFLCDTCKYNDARYCGRAERPNATRCDDYRRR
jgi:hypothetical protein